MNHQYTLLFLALRKEKKIGRIWPQPGGYLVAPLDAVEGMNDLALSHFMTTRALETLIDELNGVFRKPVRSETFNLLGQYRRVG